MKTVAIVLAAGNGTRFGKTDVNKTATKINGKSLIQIGIENIENIVDSIIVVVGYKKKSVINSIQSNKVTFVNQSKRLGTGHAIKLALKHINKLKIQPDNILAVNGDHLFMIKPKVLVDLINNHVENSNDATILTTINKKPYKLDNGRIRRKKGKIVSIVEKDNFNPRIRFISELNTGTYAFKFNAISKILEGPKFTDNNLKELYITKSLFGLNKIGSHTVNYNDVGSGVNTKKELEIFNSKNNLQQKIIILKNKIAPTFLLLLFLFLITGLILYKSIFIVNMTIAVPTFWTIYSIIATLFLVSRIPYAYLYKDDHSKEYSKLEYPNVSIIIAAKNEEKGIFKTISSCINSIYEGEIECIVIDDGSTDGTQLEVIKAQKIFGDSKVKLIIHSENKGKREAMSAGIEIAQYEIITFVDSDSYLTPYSIRHITEHFLTDNKIGAVSGNTKVENEDFNLLTKMQSILYAVSFDIYKASESVHSSVTCCPGCFSAYRKDIIMPLIEKWKNRTFLGSKSTFGDDRGLTNFVLQGWKIVYCEKAKASTLVPTKFSTYWKQQLRWKKSWIREGLFTCSFIWKTKHPLASIAFYTSLSFCIIGPILASTMLIYSIKLHSPILFIIFISGFILLGIVFALFVRIYRGSKNWMYMPFVSLLFVSCLMWQMPLALLTIRKTHWGTR